VITRAHAARGPALAAGLLLFGLAVGSQFVAATYGEAAAPPPVRLADAPEAYRDHLRLVDGIPVLHLTGTPREMGRQHGALLKAQIHFLYREYYQAMVERAVGKDELQRWAESVEPYIPERYREEMRGLAEGCGLSYEEVLRVNTMIDRFQTVFCSTVVATGAATRDGEVIFGRNLDFLARGILHRMTVVLVWNGDLAAVTWPGLVGVLSGMNVEGVAGATMMIHGNPAVPGMPYLIMYREALERARKTSDVYDAIAKAKRTCPNNFMVVDATGANEVVEFDTKTVARRPARDGCNCATNFFQTEALREVGMDLGEGRFDKLEAFLARDRGRIDVEAVRKALIEVADPMLNLNVQSMIFLPGRRTLLLAKGDALPAARQPFVELDRTVLFGAPERK